MSKLSWSPYQQTVFDFVEDGTGNGLIEAVAGSGKTTTIVEALRRIEFSCDSTLFLAFNKSIAEELKSRNVNARTFHSLTYGPVTKFLGVKQVINDKTFKIMDSSMSFNNKKIYGAFVSRLISLAKQAGIGCLVDDTEDQWYALVDHYDISLESDLATVARGVELARETFEYCNTSPVADFDDLLYLAVKEGISLPKFGFVFVDEAQDTNAIQRAILRKVLNKNARMVAVGDPAQAIYGFRGSDNNSLNLIAEEFNCTKLPLTVSYRCPKSVVNHAKQWVNHIESHDSAPEGEVISLNKQWSVKDFKSGDMIVCRTTKPIIALAYKMMKNKAVAPHILGRDIGKGLTSLINKMKAKGIDHLVNKLDAWHTREVEKAQAKKQESKIEQIDDKYDSIMCLIEGLDENHRTVPELIRTIDMLFADKANAATLCTIHKSKGLEAERVYWLNSSMCPAPWVNMEWEFQQEKNLCYVATTRAKETLVLIEE